MDRTRAAQAMQSALGPMQATDPTQAMVVGERGTGLLVDLDGPSTLSQAHEVRWHPGLPIQLSGSARADAMRQDWMPAGFDGQQFDGVWLRRGDELHFAGPARLMGASHVGGSHLILHLHEPLPPPVYGRVVGHLGTLTLAGNQAELPRDCAEVVRTTLRKAGSQMLWLQAVTGWAPMVRQVEGAWFIAQDFLFVSPFARSGKDFVVDVEGQTLRIDQSFAMSEDQVVEAIEAMVRGEPRDWRVQPMT